jgi:putative DNA primase/helicase
MSFIDFARAHGVDIDPNKLYASDRIKRTGTIDKPKSTNGAYFWDGQRGWIFNWSGEAKTIWYDDPNATPWTDQEKRDWLEKRRQLQSAQTKKYEQTGKEAEYVLKMAKMDHHPYLEIKGFKEEKGLVMNNKLLIPMRNVITNKVQGYQSIYFDYLTRKFEKKMLYGMKSKNAVFWMGEGRAPAAWLVEGYATGLSLYKALRSIGNHDAVIVCFSANNMKAVAETLKCPIKIFADNDKSGVGEATAKETGKPYVMADEVGWDANDLHKKKGLFAVVAKIMEI